MNCATCLPLDCANLADIDRYSLDGPNYQFVINCPEGFDCNNSQIIHLICCDRDIVVTFTPEMTLEQRLALLREKIAECAADWESCDPPPCPPYCPPPPVCNPSCLPPPINCEPNCPPPWQLYFNDTQTCAVTCPLGGTFSYTIRAGTYAALTEDAANFYAHQAACIQASLRRICLLPTSLSCCIGSNSSMSIKATGQLAISPTNNFWAISSGSIPTGMTFHGGFTVSNSVVIDGPPTAGGTFTFTVRIVTPDGSFQERQYSIDVLGITTASPLPSGTVGSPYSITLATAGGVNPITGVIKTGYLPDGLAFDTNNLKITGTPTLANAFTFTVEIEDSSPTPKRCSKEFSITVGNPVTSPDLYYPMYVLTDRTPEIVGPYASRDLVNLGFGPIAVINDGIISKALRFDPNAGVSRNFPLAVSPISSFKCARFWLRYGGTTTPATGGQLFQGTAFKMFLTIDQPNTDPDSGDPIQDDYFLWLRSAGGLVFGHKYPVALTKNQWHHIVWAYNTTTQIASLFVDTVLDTYSVNYNPYPDHGTFQVKYTPFASVPFDLCEIALWGTHILTQTEIVADYNNGVGKTWPW